MTEQELNEFVEARLADRLAARMQAEHARLREEVIRELRREAEREHHAKINRRHPIEGPLAGLTPAQHAERLRLMSERSAKANREMDVANARVVEGSLMSRRRADAAGGGVGFKIK
jgi:hypothetical protein